MFTATQRIRELREQGFEVKVRVERPVKSAHMRKPLYMSMKDWAVEREEEQRMHVEYPGWADPIELLARGGRVEVTITAPDGWTFTGESRCNPKLDNFNKKIGLEIAFGRAMSKLDNYLAFVEEVHPEPQLKPEKIPHGVIWRRTKEK